ncbi:MAG TPA: DUF202 domain-containing protein [Nevskiaceae bacterium]
MPDPNDDAQLAIVQQMVALQSRVWYMNVDRTLATWTRTALALIVFGIVVDRYGLLLTHARLAHVGTRLASNPVSSVGGMVAVALGLFVVVTAAVRHQACRAAWNRRYGSDQHFGPWLAFPFAVMVAAVGSALLVLLLWFGR